MKTGSSSPPQVAQLPPVITRKSLKTGAFAWAGVGAALVVAVVLFRFNPTEHGFYPACQFYKMTGLLCPGCGSLRALHNLAHGEIVKAFHCNPLLVVLLPMLGYLGIRWLKRGHATVASDVRFTGPVAVGTLLAVTIAFGILRNLPWPAFAWMSP